MSDLACVCCGALLEKHLAVYCCVCKKPYRGSCVGLSSSEIRKINEKKKGLNWNCSNCNAMGQDIADLKALILGLQVELRELRTSRQNISSEDNFEELIQEFEERQARKVNLIVFGVPEQEPNLDGMTRMGNDKTTISNILTTIVPDVQLPADLKTTRLGKFMVSNSRPRPVRVKLAKVDMVHDIVRKFKEAKSAHNELRRISVSFDRTPRQLQYLNGVKTELRRRQDGGEENLKIKFVNGMPKITSLN